MKWTYTKCSCGHPACDQHVLSNQGSVGFSEADARLMCAAPELLEAIKVMKEFFLDTPAAGVWWGPNPLEIARIAITQAEKTDDV